VWINSYDTTSGPETLIKNDVPMLSVCGFLNLFDYMKSTGAQERLAADLASLHGKRMFSLVNPVHLEESLKSINRAGLTTGKITPVKVPFYSARTKLRMMLVEVLPTRPAANNSDPVRADSTGRQANLRVAVGDQ
jgi:hypothetical protein